MFCCLGSGITSFSNCNMWSAAYFCNELDRGSKIAYLEEPCRCNDNHQPLSQLLHPQVKAVVGSAATNARAALECVRDEHAVIGEEPATLDDIVTATAYERGTDDTNHLGEQVKVLFQGTWVRPVGLKFWIRRK